LTVTWAYNAGTNTATASGAGSTNVAALVAADVAGGWGKFTVDATGKQVQCGAKIIQGDGTNAVTWADSGLQILELSGARTADNQIFWYVRNNSTLTLGTSSDTTNKLTSNPCTIQTLNTSYYGWAIKGQSNTATIYLYGTCFYSPSATLSYTFEATRAWNINTQGAAHPSTYGGGLTTSDYNNVTASNIYGFRGGGAGITTDNLLVSASNA